MKGMYKLEGDGPLGLESITASIQLANNRNLHAVAERLSGTQPNNMRILLSHGQQSVQPAVDYFNGSLPLLCSALWQLTRLHASFPTENV